MRILFNSTWQVDVSLTQRHDVSSHPYTAARTNGRPSDYSGGNWDTHYLLGFGPAHWFALIGQMVGCPVCGTADQQIVNVIASEWGGKHYLFETYYDDTSSAGKHMITRNAEGDPCAIEDLEDDVARDLAMDIYDILTAPLPGSTPFGVPGQQLTIGNPVFSPTDSNKRLQVDITAWTADDRTYVPTFWDNNTSISVSVYQMSAIFEVMLNGSNEVFHRWHGSSQIYGYSHGFWLGVLYNGSDNMVGLEIMECRADRTWRSDGSLYSKSLVRFVWGFQIMMGRVLAALDAGKNGGQSSEVDYDRIQTMITNAVNAAINATTGQGNRLSGEIAAVGTKVDGITDQNGATQFNQAVSMAVILSAYRKAISPKRLQQAIEVLSDAKYGGVTQAPRGTRLSELEPNVLTIFMELADKYGRLIPKDEEPQTNHNETEEEENDDEH